MGRSRSRARPCGTRRSGSPTTRRAWGGDPPNPRPTLPKGSDPLTADPRPTLPKGSDPRYCAAAARRAALIGLGPGLTPEGDDVVAAWPPWLPSGPWPAAEKDAWLRGAARSGSAARTTALSATLLELAAAGMGPEPLQALLGGRREALARLLRIGHSTGRAYALAAGRCVNRRVALAMMCNSTVTHRSEEASDGIRPDRARDHDRGTRRARVDAADGGRAHRHVVRRRRGGDRPAPGRRAGPALGRARHRPRRGGRGRAAPPLRVPLGGVHRTGRRRAGRRQLDAGRVHARTPRATARGCASSRAASPRSTSPRRSA